MNAQPIHREVFKRGSKTYFNSSLFFPRVVREDVSILYAFVRTADDCVDDTPQRPEDLARMRRELKRALEGSPVDDVIVSTFADLVLRKNIAFEWVDGFFHSMELDLTKKTYQNVRETIDYIYGSAEVIGLFMARILDLPEESLAAARMQGRSMQYINFLRDIAEDQTLGRTYLPLSETELTALDEEAAKANAQEFRRFIKAQLDRYGQWQAQAEAGYRHIPRRYRIPIKTASDMYNWTARKIEQDPFVIYRHKVKPSRLRILIRVIANAVAGA